MKSELTSDDPNTAQESVMSQQFPASGYVYGALPMFLQAINWFEPTANMFNPFVTNDPAVLDLISHAAAAPADEQNAAWQAVQAYGVENAWYVGVAAADIGLVAGDDVDCALGRRLLHRKPDRCDCCVVDVGQSMEPERDSDAILPTPHGRPTHQEQRLGPVLELQRRDRRG